MIIHQGDQYAIPVKIKLGNEIITPGNCNDVRIKINDKLLEYSTGGLLYSATEQVWQFPLTESISFNYGNTVMIQIAVKLGTDYLYSPVKKVEVGSSIIKELWGGN